MVEEYNGALWCDEQDNETVNACVCVHSGQVGQSDHVHGHTSDHHKNSTNYALTSLVCAVICAKAQDGMKCLVVSVSDENL